MYSSDNAGDGICSILHGMGSSAGRVRSLNMCQSVPLFILFRHFLNAMTNIAQNLTI